MLTVLWLSKAVCVSFYPVESGRIYRVVGPVLRLVLIRGSLCIWWVVVSFVVLVITCRRLCSGRWRSPCGVGLTVRVVWVGNIWCRLPSSSTRHIKFIRTYTQILGQRLGSRLCSGSNMGGVPFQSKGCQTCKSRKIKVGRSHRIRPHEFQADGALLM
jgi:hypothetical protein